MNRALRPSRGGETEALRRRMASIIEQYLQLDDALRDIERRHFRVCIFGSARIEPNDAVYDAVYRVSRQLALLGIDIVTGGGPGLMEAANRAVRDAKIKRVRSYGLPLDIPGLKEVANAHLDIKSMHRRFSSRLDEFMRLSDGVIVAPGGIGTLLELFYVWQLLQLSMIDSRPVVLLGRDYWTGLIEWVRAEVAGRGLIHDHDLDMVTVVDSPEEAVAAIEPVHRAFLEERRRERKAMREARRTNQREVLEAAREAIAEGVTVAAPLIPNGGRTHAAETVPGSAAAPTGPEPIAIAHVTPVDSPPRPIRRTAARRDTAQTRERRSASLPRRKNTVRL